MTNGMNQSFILNSQQNQMQGNPVFQAPQHNLPAFSGFSYQGSETSYSPGSNMGLRAAGAMGGAYQAGSLGITAAGAYAGYRAGGLSGMARGALFAGGPLLAGGAALGGFAFSNMAEGAQEQQMIANTLSATQRFTSGTSRTNRGFGRSESKAISDFVRELQSVPELMTSMNELNSIMSKVSQMGVMNGVRNAQEFQRRFKESISTLKDISKIMETTMEDALKYFEDARRSGMYSPGMMKHNAMQRQFTAGVTGMNQEQIGNLQFMGSQISFGYGGTRGSGAQNALRSARQIGMANELGLISNDRIAELTGFEGSQGIAAMSGSLADAAQRMSQGGLGTAMSIALGKTDKGGRFTGAMDEELVEKVRMGGISKQELLRLAHKKTATRAGKMSFKANENMLRSEMASQVGAEGISMELGDILGGAGFSNPDALNIVSQRFGVNERDAKIIAEMGRNMPEIQRELGGRAQTEGRRQAEQSYLKENLSNDAIKRKLYKKLENTFSEPFKHMGSNIANAVGTYVDNFMDSLLDRYSVHISKSVSSLASGALGGHAGSQQQLSAMIKSAGTMDLSRGAVKSGVTDSALEMLTGFKSDSAKRADILKDLSLKGLATEDYKGLRQDDKQREDTKRYFGDLQSGNFQIQLRRGGLAGFAGASGTRKLEIAKGKVAEVIKEHGVEMSKMSQMDRVKFIKDKIGSTMLYGVPVEEVIAAAQHGTATDNLGSVDFNKLGRELMGVGDFGSAPQLKKAEDEARGALAKAFGDKQSSQAEALLRTDSKSRDLLLAASKGESDAVRLLTKELSTQEKEKLMHKYGVSEEQFGQVASIFGGRTGDVSKLAGNMENALNRSSFGGLAAQLRRQGLDIEKRLGSSGLMAGTAKDAIRTLHKDLSGLTDAESLKGYLTGRGASEIDKALGAVSRLDGADREKAMDVLGEGARSAFGYGDFITRTVQRGKGGIDQVRKSLASNPALAAELEGMLKDGKIDKGEASELGRKARNAAYGASLSSAGEVKKQDITFNKDLMEKLNLFAQTTNQFAQLVVQATPQLSENVKQAQKNAAASGSQLQNATEGK